MSSFTRNVPRKTLSLTYSFGAVAVAITAIEYATNAIGRNPNAIAERNRGYGQSRSAIGSARESSLSRHLSAKYIWASWTVWNISDDLS